MNAKLSSLFLVLALVGSGPVLLAQSDTIEELDDLTPGQLEREIMDEIDDLFHEMRVDANGVYDSDQIEERILYAFSDAGDDDNEDDVDYDELQEEMDEAGTTLEDVVADALDEEEISSMGDTPSFRVENARLGLMMQSRNPRIRAGTAFCAATRAVVRTALPRRPYQSGCRR